jgi:hypothetical protein
MFCPQCKAEYRPGFTRCADCDVPLVDELPAEALVAPEPAAAPGDPEEDPFCSFWSGDDPRIHAELCELLDKERIPHKTVRREDHLFRISRYPAFQIGIPFSMFERAEAAVKEAYGSEPEAGAQDAALLLPYEKERATSSRTVVPWLPASRGFAWSGGYSAEKMTSVDDSAREPSFVETFAEEPREDWDREDWHPEDATVEIWSAESAEPVDMLGSSLRENQIHFRFTQTGGKHRLFVLPEDETRAREIVREVVEGVPPE